MARRRGAGPDAYTFDLEPDGDEAADAAPVVRSTRAARTADTAAQSTPGHRRRRRRRRGERPADTLLIDLDPGLDPDDGPAEPDPDLPDAAVGSLDGMSGPAGGGLRRAADRLRGALRGRRLVAAVVLVAAGLTFVVVDTVGDRGRLAALRAAPGGVVDLTDEPREVWRVGADGGASGGLVGVVDGLVVAQREDALVGLDVETGDRRWQVELPDGSSSCGPGMQTWSGTFPAAPAEQLVCVSATAGDDSADGADGADEGGSQERSTVTVVAADGTVAATREVAASHSMLFPGSGGGLVTVAWVGEAGPVDPRVADDVVAGTADAGAIPDGYDLQVRLEDAATGEPRWEHTVQFDGAVDPALCVRWSEDGTTSGVDLRGGVQAMVTDKLVWLGGCGIDAWFTPGGERLDRPGDPGTFEGFSVEPLTGGGYVARVDVDAAASQGATDRLLRDDGSEVREVRGRYLVPLSTDGGGDGVHLERRRGTTVATDDDGDELWRDDVRSTSLLVRTAQVAVVVDEGRRVHGLDLGTGEVLWMREDLVEGLDAWGAYGPRFVEAAFTDGRLAAFVVPDYTRSDVVHWVALDAATGAQLWQVELGGDGWGVQLAVDGRLVRWSPSEIVGLG